MGYDQDRYNSLISRAAFDCSFYKGTWQDLSPARRTMTAVGSPSFTMVNGLPALRQNAVGDGSTSAVVPAIVDPSGAFSIEVCGAVYGPAAATWGYFLRQQTLGGFFAYVDPSTQRFLVATNTAAGALARTLQSPVGSFPRATQRHLIMSSTSGATAGLSWVAGVPGAVTLGGAGVSAPCNPAAVIVMAQSDVGVRVQSLIIRVFPFALTNEDCAALYGAARALTGGEV
jgi:hypothetical protein